MSLMNSTTITLPFMRDIFQSRNSRLEDKIKKCQSQSRMDLRKQKLTDQDIEIVIQQALINKQCTMLWLAENQITSQSVSTLASALHNNTTLEGLSICDNHISDVSVQSLAQVLSMNNSNLKRLALTANEITDNGVEHLAEMLKTNCTLTQLWLGSNKIGDRGVQLLTDVLVYHNASLEVLSLSWNNLISDSSVDYFIAMLEYNQSLKILGLSNCNLSQASKIRLQEVNKSQKDCYLDY